MLGWLSVCLSVVVVHIGVYHHHRAASMWIRCSTIIITIRSYLQATAEPVNVPHKVVNIFAHKNNSITNPMYAYDDDILTYVYNFCVPLYVFGLYLLVPHMYCLMWWWPSALSSQNIYYAMHTHTLGVVQFWYRKRRRRTEPHTILLCFVWLRRRLLGGGDGGGISSSYNNLSPLPPHT